MSLNIKNERVHDLVRELAKLTGQNQTSAVEMAVVRMLAEERDTREARLARLLKITERAAPHIKPGAGSQDIDELLYDDLGLPK